ncbi:hypothetical protein Q8A67_004215 [Cirrhinus molitorella]|uniref:Uncharacterized protein n=1 Tax=Cirrhinus molitorella TaxID=172907 RepID=A0AA88QBD8_9TELE|nr:hypothetical protein Q8A67_004215 [Cirrhinus molitorella]
MFFLSFLSNEIESRKLPGVIVGPKGVLEWRALCLSVAGKLLKTAVRVGKVKKIDCDNHPLQKSWSKSGYDCAWVPPNSNITTIKSGREEDCVWDPKRITVIDVACCVDHAKRKELRRMIRSNLKPEGCDLCHLDTSENHDVQPCWECQEDICPFQSKHVCKSRKFREREMH